jgi:hypothetical protein
MGPSPSYEGLSIWNVKNSRIYKTVIVLIPDAAKKVCAANV